MAEGTKYVTGCTKHGVAKKSCPFGLTSILDKDKRNSYRSTLNIQANELVESNK
jgi:hypothetical protein